MIFSRDEVLKRLRTRIDRGEPIIGGGAGTGISAKFEEAGGIDLIVIYNSGRYRMAGRGSLAGLMPYGDANGVVVEMAGEVLPVVKDTPVLAGVCASDPFRLIDRFLDQLKLIGFSGVQNFPTVGLIDGTFRANLEETEMGYDKEVELIRLAHEREMLTTPYVFNTQEAEQMAAVRAKAHPEFRPGDTLKVSVKVVDVTYDEKAKANKTRERLQAFEGVCIARQGAGINESFTVRKISYGEGVERVFPVYSPLVDSVTVVRKGKVRRAKLYYLRGRTGKSARISERVDAAGPEAAA